jgi:protein involved in polysaccharide export with SLBB domain
MTEYLIQPGDQLDVRFYNNPELNEQITVRPDGRISTQLAPEIMAANKTPADLSRMLIQAYSSELRDPRITVIVRTFASNKIYVGGEVGRPGIIDLVGSMTVLQSVAGAGGFLDTARKNEIVVIRKAEKRPLILTADISRVIDGSDLKQDLNLKPYDVVFVPKSPIANVNLWVDQYVRKLIPIPFGFGFGFDL